MPLCIFTLENKKYYIKQYQQDLIDSISNMVEKLNNPDLFLTTLKPTVQNISWIIENPIITYKIVDTEKLEDTTVQLMKEFGMQSTRSDLCPNAYINFEESEYLRGRINEEEQPVMDRIAILDGQIEVLKDVYSKLDSERIIIERYSDYMNYVINYNNSHCTPNPISNLLTDYEKQIFNQNILFMKENKINLCNNYTIENYFDAFKNINFRYSDKRSLDINELKSRFLSNYIVTEDIIKAKIAKIKYDNLINKYGDKKIIEENLQDLLTKKLKLIDSDEYKNIDIF
jgi:hypothetical protein